MACICFVFSIALLRVFISPNVTADRLQWEQRSLDALAVYYVDKYKNDTSDSETRAHSICKEASELFCEDFLQRIAVRVSISDDCQCLAM